MTPDQEQFIASVTPGALATERTHGVPAAVTIAQAILESGWGKTRLATEGRNLFGIKAGAGWAGDVTMLPTSEYLNGKWVTVNAAFRKYADVADSIRDHAEFLRSRKWYDDAFNTATPDDFVRALVNPGEPAYATDPAYASKVIALMDQYGLREVGKATSGIAQADLDAVEKRVGERIDDLSARIDALAGVLAEAANHIRALIEEGKSDG